MKNLTTANALFLISFHGVSEHFIFSNGENEILGNLIQAHGRHGINFIKIYNKVKSKFERTTKKQIEILFNWDTHSIQQLEKTNFLKK